MARPVQMRIRFIKKIYQFAFLLFLLTPNSSFGQITGYQRYIDTGKEDFKSSQYRKALISFKAANKSKDKPKESDALEWIKKTNKCIKLKRKADGLMNQNNYQAAALIYQQIIEINPEDSYSSLRKKICNDIPENMVFVEGGEFFMGNAKGDEDENKVHQIRLSSFYINKYEVTNKQFCAFLNELGNQTEDDALWIDIEDGDCAITYRNGKYRPKIGMAPHPVVEVSWYGARAYAKWAHKRLPTEAEWEYAAKGGKRSKKFTYSGANTPMSVGWYDKNAQDQTHPVGLKKPNELQIYDMTGNVWEWCADWYSSIYYKESPYINPQGPKYGEFKVIRGGSWVTIEKDIRITIRDYNPVDTYNYGLGFRCVMDIEL